MTIRIEWRIGFWIGAFLLLVLLLWLFSGVLLPFAAGGALGYLLNPVVDRLERVGFSRLGATLFTMACLVLVLGLIFVLIVPVLWRQLAGFIKVMPAYAVKLEGLISVVSENIGREYKLGLGNNTGPDLGNAASDLVASAAQWGASFLNSILTRGEALITLVSLLVVTPIVAFYMLLDWHKMIATIDKLIPPRNREMVRTLAHQIDAAMAGFLRGQSLVCLYLGIRCRPVADQAQFWPFDRDIGRCVELHPLFRLLDCPRFVLDGCDRPGLARLEAASHVALRHFNRAIYRREYFVAKARW
jgi:predicted PurR-regulated permease PerM